MVETPRADGVANRADRRRPSKRSQAAMVATPSSCWLRPDFESGALEPVLEPWWQRFAGPYLYYPGRRLVPAPLRAFVDFIKLSGHEV